MQQNATLNKKLQSGLTDMNFNDMAELVSGNINISAITSTF